jgi:hypothetical protein
MVETMTETVVMTKVEIRQGLIRALNDDRKSRMLTVDSF